MTVDENPLIPHQPTDKQAQFLALEELEGFYGGAAGGGKSDALLAAGLQYAGVPGYAGIIFRRSYTDLALPGALMDRANEWLRPTGAYWNEREKTWRFGTGGTLTFGYLEHEVDKYRYQSAEFQFIGFDELTEFTEGQYRFLFSRLRRLAGSKIPLRMRSASNPGGVGHEWVKQRFVVEGNEDRPFIPARLEDNPYLDLAEYEEALAKLDPVTRAQLRLGDWEIREGGLKFKREWFEIVDAAPKGVYQVRYWDLAATEPKAGRDPDWTVGALVAKHEGVYWLKDIRRMRARPMQVEALIKQTAQEDGKDTEVWMEQEPGASGVAMIDHYARKVLAGYAFRGLKTTGAKEVRANPVSSAAEAGNLKLVRGAWLTDMLDEFDAFPLGPHDDQVDAVSGAVEVMADADGYEPSVETLAPYEYDYE